MKNLINIYKPIGQTPLQLINRLKEKYPKYQDKKIAYAGRLDPLAHGVMILLVEPETKNAKRYQNLDKEYEFDVLFGLETDTYDVLGQIRNSKLEILNKLQIPNHKLQTILERTVGKQKQPYPPFSSKTVKGKPLFWWARNDRLSEIEIPKKEIEIYSLVLKKLRTEERKRLRNTIINKVKLVKGDFRQDQILDSWKTFFKNTSYKKFTIAKIIISCSSGTYVRSIAHNLGKEFTSCGAIALEIKRTKVGKHTLKDSVRI